jgi:hypothetical protein
MDPAVPAGREWSGDIRPHSAVELSSCLAQGRVLYRHRPVPPSPVDVEALRLVEWACANRQTMMLCAADPLSGLPALIAAAVQVSRIIGARGQSVRGRQIGRVGVVTSSYHTRGMYRGLAVKGGLGARAELLRQVVPAATYVGGGATQQLDSAAEATGITVFARTVAEVGRLKKLDLVVVELPVPDAEAVFALDVPAIVVANDTSDPVVIRLARRVPTYCWGREDLKRHAAAGPVPAGFANLMAGPAVEVVVVQSQAVCENASLFWQDAGQLVRLGRIAPVSASLVQSSFALFHDLIGLALPLSEFEACTGSVRRRIDELARGARLLKAGELRDDYLPMVEAELGALADAVAPTPPKREALEQLIDRHLDERRRVLLVARTSRLQAAHTAFLAESGRARHVTVTHLGALVNAAGTDVVVLTGMAPAWARFVYSTGLAPLVNVLAYRAAAPMAFGTADFDESAKVTSAVGYARAHRDWLAHPAQQADCVSRLCGDQVDVVDDRPPWPGADGSAVSTVVPTPPEVPPGLWEGGSWWTRFEADSDAAGAAPAADVGELVEARLLRFEGGRQAVVASSALLTRFLAVSGRAEPGYAASSVRVGDQLVFLDKEAGKDLLAKVIEVADQVPELAVAGAWTGHWRRTLRQAYLRAGTYDALAAALARHGCTVQGQTVRLWVVGATIGPDDCANVRRLGEVAEDPVLTAHYTDVCSAIEALRGAHVKLGQRLGQWARTVGSAAVAGRIGADEVIDARSGLTAADFAGSIDILRVTAVVDDIGPVPSGMTGRLTESQEEL